MHPLICHDVTHISPYAVVVVTDYEISTIHENLHLLMISIISIV